MLYPFQTFFFFRIFIYLLMRDRGAETQVEGEAGSPLNREPDTGLDPRTLRS